MKKDRIEMLEETIVNENPVYHADKSFRNYLKRIREREDPCFTKFLWDRRVAGTKLARLNRICSSYFACLKGYILKEITQMDMDAIYLSIIKRKISNSSQRSELREVKQILRHLEIDVNLSKYKIKECLPPIYNEQLLTDDEIHIIINSKINLEKKVFFTVLFDTGLRVGEVYSIDKDSFVKEPKGYLVTIRASKSIIRVVYTYSHNHFIEKLLKTDWNGFTMSHTMSLKVLKRFEKKFNKKINHHLGRHSKVSELAHHMTEQEIKNYMGWTPDSNMFKRYVHLSNEKVVNRVKDIYD